MNNEAASPLTIHPLAEIFPPMSDEAFSGLVDDIRENGLREPIVLHEGMVLDGRYRYRACAELGIEPITRLWDQRGSGATAPTPLRLEERRRGMEVTQHHNKRPAQGATCGGPNEIVDEAGIVPVYCSGFNSRAAAINTFTDDGHAFTPRHPR